IRIFFPEIIGPGCRKPLFVKFTNAFDIVGCMPIVQGGTDRARAEMFDMSRFEGVRIFRVEIGVAAGEVSVVEKRKEWGKIVVGGPVKPPAVTYLDCIFSADIVGNVCRRKEVEVLAVVYFAGLEQFGSEVCIFAAQTELIGRLSDLIGDDKIRSVNILVVIEVVVETFERCPHLTVQFCYKKIVRDVTQGIADSGFELSIFVERVDVVSLEEQLFFRFIIVGVLKAVGVARRRATREERSFGV